MVRFLRSLPFALEFILVIAVAFGFFVTISVLTALHLANSAYRTHPGAGLVGLIVFETGIMAVLFPFLRVRGWTFEKIGLRPGLKDTGYGLLLFIVTYVAWFAIWRATVLISPETAIDIAHARVFTHHIPWGLSLAVGLINPFFEEVFVCGYLMTALKRADNPWFAINASTGLRVLYHLYQGPKGVLSIIPVGLIFSFWYARTGRMWPLVVAHSVADLIALLSAGYWAT